MQPSVTHHLNIGISPVCKPIVRIVLEPDRRNLTALVSAVTVLDWLASGSGAFGADDSIPMVVAAPSSRLPGVPDAAEAGGLSIINIPMSTVSVKVRSDQAVSCCMARANTSINDLVFMRTALCCDKQPIVTG